LGLGRLPGECKIYDLHSDSSSSSQNPGSLQNFWRSAENLWVKPPTGAMTWAVSQAAPLRRITVQGDLNLYQIVDNGGNPTMAYASGGWMSDSYV